jgi:hypothetical protein
MKKLLLFTGLVFALVIFLPGCGGSASTPATTSTAPAAAPGGEIKVTLSFPDGAPLLNQTAVFKCTVTSTRAVDKNISININANPSAFILESGQLTWSGAIPANSEKTVIEAVLKSYHTGHWQIDANYHIDAEPDSNGGDFTSTIYVSMGIPSSQWGTTPPWQK